jgi:hypothetical protein
LFNPLNLQKMKKINFVVLSKNEFQEIANLPEKKLKTNLKMKEKGITPDMGDIIVCVDGELHMMTTEKHDFGTLLLPATIVERHG